MDAIKTGTLIAQARREKNMTQKELSELLHVTDRAVSKWERGLSFPDVSLLEPLAGALGLTLTELLDGERAALAPETDERPLREILQLSKAALRKKSTKLKLLSAAAGILALILLGMGVYRIWNAPSRPAHASTHAQKYFTHAKGKDARGTLQQQRAQIPLYADAGRAERARRI